MIIPPEKLSKILGVPIENTDCAGLKLTLSEIYIAEEKGFLGFQSRSLPRYKPLSPRGNVYQLKPGGYIVRYSEYVRIPADAIALAIPRSSLLRMGATLYTAVWDPGYEGRGYGLLYVYNPYGIALERGVQIAQLVYIKMETETKRLYRGIYQGEK